MRNIFKAVIAIWSINFWYVAAHANPNSQISLSVILEKGEVYFLVRNDLAPQCITEVRLASTLFIRKWNGSIFEVMDGHPNLSSPIKTLTVSRFSVVGTHYPLAYLKKRYNLNSESITKISYISRTYLGGNGCSPEDVEVSVTLKWSQFLDEDRLRNGAGP